MRLTFAMFIALGLMVFGIRSANAGPASSAIREVAELIVTKFGTGTAGRTVEEVSAAMVRTAARHGEASLPLLKSAGHAGFVALDQAGAKAPDILKLFAQRGDEAVWLISDPVKLSLFLKHGQPAATALLKHPGIADPWITRYGDDAVGALNSLSRQGAQRLGMLANDGSTIAAEMASLLPVIRSYGDEAMEFIWRHKGALAVTSVLATFIAHPESYISGAKELVIDPIKTSILGSWLIPGLLIIVLLPFIARFLIKSLRSMKRRN